MTPKLTLVYVPLLDAFVINKLSVKPELKLTVIRNGIKLCIHKKHLAFAVTISADELIAQARQFIYSYLELHAPLVMTIISIEKEDTGLLCIVHCIDHSSFFIVPITYKHVIDKITNKPPIETIAPYSTIRHFKSVEELKEKYKSHINLIGIGLSFNYDSFI